MVTSINRIQSALNFLKNQFLVFYCRSYIFELRQVFKEHIAHPYVVIFSLHSVDETLTYTYFSWSLLLSVSLCFPSWQGQQQYNGLTSREVTSEVGGWQLGVSPVGS
jgi:hypothetical protein